MLFSLFRYAVSVFLFLASATLCAAQGRATVYIVEDDHASLTAQMSQAEALFELYFLKEVQDIVLEGYVGSEALSNFLPKIGPSDARRRFSITAPAFLNGNISAAEFVGSVFPIRLHSGENEASYTKFTVFHGVLCEMLSTAILARMEQLMADEVSDRSAFAEVNAKVGRLRSLKKRVNEGQFYEIAYDKAFGEAISFFSTLVIRGDTTLAALPSLWKEGCSATADIDVVDIERRLFLYEFAEQVAEGTDIARDLLEKSRADRDFLKARSQASRLIAQRAISILREFNRNLAIVAGAGHTKEIQQALISEGIPVEVILRSVKFGRLGRLTLNAEQWERKQRGQPTNDNGFLEALAGAHILRKPVPVVNQSWFKAQYELASISQGLVDDAQAFLLTPSREAPRTFPATDAALNGELISVDSKNVEIIRGPKNQFAAILFRAARRLDEAEPSLWVAARPYKQISVPGTGNLASSEVRTFFGDLKKVEPKHFQREFGPVNKNTAKTGNAPKPTTQKLSLRTLGIIGSVRKQVQQALLSTL